MYGRAEATVQIVDAEQISEFLSSLHIENIALVAMSIVSKGDWHWLIPDSWERNEVNRVTLYYSCAAYLAMNKLN